MTQTSKTLTRAALEKGLWPEFEALRILFPET